MIAILIAILLCHFPVQFQAVSKGSPTPEEIISKMQSVYASCASYVDEGEVRTTFLKEDGNQPTVRSTQFETAFVRASDFRFECKTSLPYPSNNWGRSIIHRTGNSVRTWHSFMKPHLGTASDLRMAIAADAGTSSLSGTTVPELLIPELGNPLITRLVDLQLLGEEEVEGRAAYKIEGSYNPIDLGRTTIWIDEQTMMVLKIYSLRKRKDWTTETTTIYRSQINVEVPLEKLKFNPPAR
jgi:outer membrane lipoprotein-sorting protein